MSAETILESKNKEIDTTVHKEQGRLLNFINTRMPSAEDAEDILQDVFYEFVETTREAEPLEKAVAWLYRVAKNKITDWYRKRKPERFENRTVNDEEEDEPLFLTDILSSVDRPADDQMLLKAISEELTDALELLPEKQKQVFVLHELEGLSLKQIAEQTQVPVKTVISRKHYAVQFLREHLRGLYNELLNN
jgi:RNA polymerase sigma factor (sigma-70 family)